MSYKLLTTGNPKSIKGQKKGFLSFLLHLAPFKLSGYQTCASASPGCSSNCLNTAGRGGLFPGEQTKDLSGFEVYQKILSGELVNRIQLARIRRTRMFFEDRDTFMSILVREIQRGIRYAERKGMIPCFRLNATSDLLFEHVRIGKYQNIFEMFSNVQFYDYTKHVKRFRYINTIPNYHLTFSRSEENDQDCMEVYSLGGNVAVVYETLPSHVFNGDETDLRFLDPSNVIVGLKAKGKARHDTTGFVIRKHEIRKGLI